MPPMNHRIDKLHAVSPSPRSPFLGDLALGAAIGAIAGDAGKGAAIGAVAGGLRGGMEQRKERKAEEQQAQTQATAQQQQAISTFDRAYAACLEGRGYTVR